MMPQLSGLKLLNQSQSLPPGAVRILITASDRVEDLKEAVNVARIHRFVGKPLRLVELRGVIVDALRSA